MNCVVLAAVVPWVCDVTGNPVKNLHLQFVVFCLLLGAFVVFLVVCSSISGVFPTFGGYFQCPTSVAQSNVEPYLRNKSTSEVHPKEC